MAKSPKLPRTIAESLRFKKKELSPLQRAVRHEKKAERLRKDEKKSDGDKTPHIEFLERMQSIRAAQETVQDAAEKEALGLRGDEEIPTYEVLTHLISKLPRPRMERVMADERIGKLNALMLRPARKIQQVIDFNDQLKDLKISFRVFTDARRDLKVHLGRNAHKSARALAIYFTVIEAAADPKVRKKANWVQDTEILELANAILRDLSTHILGDMKSRKDSFFDVGKRRDDALLAKGGRKV